ncbi:MAG: DNA adenine methylase [Candidatus Moranbacteria bacterium]|nr:DNA adenine methylase [Candidatus Moranbacteria bacterium]
MKKFSFTSACYPYLGSKAKQASSVGSYIKPNHKVLVSPFCGGASFELYAKHRLGMKTVTSDFSYISFVAQKALLENNSVRISQEDIVYLFAPNKNSGYVRKNYSRFFSDFVLKFLDTATENIRRLPESSKKYVLSHLLIYYIFHILPFGKLSCTHDTENIKKVGLAEALEEASNFSEARTRKLLISCQHPLPVLKKLAKKINAGVTNNNQQNLVYQEDVFNFLPKTKIFADEAVLFADPPYLQSTSYSVYDDISQILLGREIEKTNSVFNSKEVENWYDKFFQACEHLDLWLITMGAKVDNPDALHADKFLKMVQKHRPNAQLLKFENFSWAINTISGKKPHDCEEFLVIAKSDNQ